MVVRFVDGTLASGMAPLSFLYCSRKRITCWMPDYDFGNGQMLFIRKASGCQWLEKMSLPLLTVSRALSRVLLPVGYRLVAVFCHWKAVVLSLQWSYSGLYSILPARTEWWARYIGRACGAFVTSVCTAQSKFDCLVQSSSHPFKLTEYGFQALVSISLIYRSISCVIICYVVVSSCSLSASYATCGISGSHNLSYMFHFPRKILNDLLRPFWGFCLHVALQICQ